MLARLESRRKNTTAAHLLASLFFAASLSFTLLSAESTVDPKYLELVKTLMASRFKNTPPNEIFKPNAEEFEREFHATTQAAQKDPLQFPKGNGVRLLMTGHSWVQPAVRTLPAIAAAGGFDGHHQRAHTSGGSTGSANSIWLTEFGKFPGKPVTPILMPALATGQWDVMSWGAYYGDTLECYTQWIDVCLKQNPAMTFLIQDGWPIYPPLPETSPKEDFLGAFDAQQVVVQQEMFRKPYDGLNERYPGKVHIIPAGAAVLEMLHHYYAGRLPGYDCVNEKLGGKRGIYSDGGHLSKNGMEQLVGYLYYGMLYRQSPERISNYKPAGIDPTVDQLMRKAAWNAITHSPFSGITDKDGKGMADEPAEKK